MGPISGAQREATTIVFGRVTRTYDRFLWTIKIVKGLGWSLGYYTLIGFFETLSSSCVVNIKCSEKDTMVLINKYDRNNKAVENKEYDFVDITCLKLFSGLILSQYVPKWMEQRETLRLSQIIDIYYSNDGVTFNPNVKACNRESLFTEVLDLNILYKEVKDFSQILILRQGSVYIPPEILNEIAVIVVDAFIEYYREYLTNI